MLILIDERGFGVDENAFFGGKSIKKLTGARSSDFGDILAKTGFSGKTRFLALFSLFFFL